MDEWDWWERPDDAHCPPRLPGGPRERWARVYGGGTKAPAPRTDQRMGKRDLARMGLVMAAEKAKTPLEIVEAVARGDLSLSSQRLQAAIAALPYRHAKLAPVPLTQGDELGAALAGLTEQEIAAELDRIGADLRAAIGRAATGAEGRDEAPRDPGGLDGVVH